MKYSSSFQSTISKSNTNTNFDELNHLSTHRLSRKEPGDLSGRRASIPKVSASFDPNSHYIISKLGDLL